MQRFLGTLHSSSHDRLRSCESPGSPWPTPILDRGSRSYRLCMCRRRRWLRPPHSRTGVTVAAYHPEAPPVASPSPPSRGSAGAGHGVREGCAGSGVVDGGALELTVVWTSAARSTERDGEAAAVTATGCPCTCRSEARSFQRPSADARISVRGWSQNLRRSFNYVPDMLRACVGDSSSMFKGWLNDV